MRRPGRPATPTATRSASGTSGLGLVLAGHRTADQIPNIPGRTLIALYDQGLYASPWPCVGYSCKCLVFANCCASWSILSFFFSVKNTHTLRQAQEAQYTRNPLPNTTCHGPATAPQSYESMRVSPGILGNRLGNKPY